MGAKRKPSRPRSPQDKGAPRRAAGDPRKPGSTPSRTRHAQSTVPDRSSAAFRARCRDLLAPARAARTPPPIPPEIAGAYRIAGVISRGGQGFVYDASERATERRVAIKRLRSGAFATVRERHRFDREARIAASLKHPNVAALITRLSAGAEEFLVFEFVEGRPLGRRLARGPLPIEDALRITRQVAAAVEAAHDLGVVHRDLKPDNVMVTPDGGVKILDFGLARRTSLTGGRPLRRTATEKRTLEGTMVGTPAYMSPEQTRAQRLDKRTDVWALGCLLYECLTGRAAFAGETWSDVIASILEREPDWAALPPATPQRVRDLLGACLEKDLRKRLRDAGDARLEIERALERREWEQAGVPNREGPRLGAPPRPGGDQRPAGPVPSRGNLPAEVTPFIGREAEIEDAVRRLGGARATRLLTFTGSGGCGKTRLALRVASELRERFPDGAWIVELGPLTDPALVPQAAASVFRVKESAGQPLVQALIQHLRSKRILLVFDNCEHVLRACAELVEGLLRACPELVVITTSRQPLGVAGEAAARVPSLTHPDAARLPTAALELVNTVASFEAVRLFVQRATLVASSFALTPDNALPVAQVCQRLDGIPLAIELAAARVNVLSVEQIAARLDDRFRLLTAGTTGALPRHRTLGALIEWSYGLLSEPERSLFRRLCVFAGGWTLEAVAGVAGEPGLDEYGVLDLLTALVDKSLVLVEDRDGERRYRLLETVRQYARARLDAEEPGEIGASVRERHADFYLRLAERAHGHLQGPEQAAWLERLEREHDNLWAAFESCRSSPSGAERGLRLAGALVRFWMTRGHLSEARAYLTDLLARGGEHAPVATRARALHGAGIVAWAQGDLAAARAHVTDSVRIWRGVGDKHGLATALNNLGIVAGDQNDFETARRAYGESLALRRELGDAIGQAQVLNNLGVIEYRTGNLDAARPLHEQSLAIKRQVGDRRGIAYSLGNLACIAVKQHHYAAARRLAAECLAISCEVGDQRGIAEVLEVWASIAGGEGKHPRALTLYGASEALREAIGAAPPPHDRADHVRIIAGARNALGEKDSGAAWSRGRAMTQDEAVAFARAEAQPGGADSPPTRVP